MGSCGNACCAAEFPSSLGAASLFDKVVVHLKAGGMDGLFNYTGGAGGLSLPNSDGSWTAIFQGTHTTFKERYLDTVNFAIRELPEGGSMVRIFSVSGIAGALEDMGQNRRTVSLLGSGLGLGPMDVLFGCGATPSMPTVSQTGKMRKAAALADPAAGAKQQQTIELMSSSQETQSHVALLLLSACGVFLAGVVVGSKVSCKYQKSEPLLAA